MIWDRLGMAVTYVRIFDSRIPHDHIKLLSIFHPRLDPPSRRKRPPRHIRRLTIERIAPLRKRIKQLRRVIQHVLCNLLAPYPHDHLLAPQDAGTKHFGELRPDARLLVRADDTVDALKSGDVGLDVDEAGRVVVLVPGHEGRGAEAPDLDLVFG